MSRATLLRLSAPSLKALARLLETSAGPFDAAHLRSAGVVPDELAVDAASLVLNLKTDLGAPSVIARTLTLLAADREQATPAAPEVVWSGPEGEAPRHRTTLAVVQGLFQSFTRTLLVSSYVVDVNTRAADLFGGLAARLDHDAALQVRFFVNVPAPRPGELAADAIGAFRARFRKNIWPGQRLPEVWFDPRSLLLGAQRAVLHAKCIVADEREAFVTSANFTEAAHERNIELGLFVRNSDAAKAVIRPFEELMAHGIVERLL